MSSQRSQLPKRRLMILRSSAHQPPAPGPPISSTRDKVLDRTFQRRKLSFPQLSLALEKWLRISVVSLNQKHGSSYITVCYEFSSPIQSYLFFEGRGCCITLREELELRAELICLSARRALMQKSTKNFIAPTESTPRSSSRIPRS